jgi:uncharacterized protein (DUF1778 family)
MWPQRKRCTHTATLHSVAFGPLHAAPLLGRLRAPPRDPDFLYNKKMAFKSVSNPKGLFLKFRVTPEEKAMIEQRAAACQVHVSTYLMRCALGRPLKSRTDMLLINELRVAANELKELHRNGGNVHEGLLRPVLDQLVFCMAQIWVAKSGFAHLVSGDDVPGENVDEKLR